MGNRPVTAIEAGRRVIDGAGTRIHACGIGRSVMGGMLS
jgi:hypothetical protein